MPTKKKVWLKDLTYYRTGGVCDFLYAPASIKELAEVISDLHKTRRKYFLLGGGTNSLVSDEPWAGGVVAFSALMNAKIEGESIYVEAGVENSAFAELCLEKGLNGAGWMNGLPGQIGGTVRMNARCYGGEISQIVKQVHVVTKSGAVKVHDGKDVFRGYKDTTLMNSGDIVAAVDIELKKGDTTATKALMAKCRADRESKGQYDFPSCGCVFKNDYSVGVPSGMLLEAAGGKKLKVGKAEVSPHHANFVFNKGASSHDILALTKKMREAVYKEFGVWLEYEMEILGDVKGDELFAVRETRPQQVNVKAVAALKEKFGNKN